VALHDGVGDAAAHEVAVVWPSGVVVLQPALELGVEVGQAGEVLAVEGRAVELLEGGALEALADRVVVGERGGMRWWRTSRTARCSVKVLAGEFGTIVAEHPGELGPDPGQAFGDVIHEGGRVSGDLSPATRLATA
jgi:hypothetical protein